MPYKDIEKQRANALMHYYKNREIIREERRNSCEIYNKIISDVDAAWLAAVIDSEGTITVIKNGSAPLIIVVNNSKEFLEHVRDIIECGGIHIKRRYKNNEERITYDYRIQRLDVVINTLKAIIPYLIIKKNNAMKILSWLESGRSTEITLEHSGCSYAAKKGNHAKKGNYGNSEAHREASLRGSKGNPNNRLRGNYGNTELHRMCGKMKGGIMRVIKT
jgi:hypothetical protein